ncbi:type III effector [Pokkaliibacter sp. MBI-7]|uniref:type III effector n=1 Tax=Pokkaliibacter sp. MBI-7 TaxID=3040600 RepID=UPI00244A00B5|nr:type III effector [Pokkaliibacter sp. MBI-7]MDH2433904.1 type III effector [Pokkaliibacter sp. MBI-7]
MINPISTEALPLDSSLPTSVSSSAPAKHPTDTSHLEKNKTVEKALTEHIAGHPAARTTMAALSQSIVQLFIACRGEIKGWADIVQAASRPHDSNRRGSGVLSPRFDVVGSVGWNPVTLRRTLHNGSLREQGTLALNMLLSDTFKGLLNQLLDQPEQSQRLQHLLDLSYLQANGKTLYQMEGWAGKMADSRTETGKARYMPAHQLTLGQISQQELAYHRHNPVNHPGQQTRVGFTIPPPADEQLQVLRGYGRHVWQVNPDSEFAQKAAAADKPTLAGPSGSASRMLAVSLLLAPACQQQLGIDDPQALKELMRYAAYGYYGQDDHHSLLEVNLGVASHGLAEQWDDSLYTQPFSQPIRAKDFTVDNQAHQHLFAQLQQE